MESRLEPRVFLRSKPWGPSTFLYSSLSLIPILAFRINICTKDDVNSKYQAIPSSIRNKGAFHFQRSNLYYSDSISSAIGKDSLVIVSVVHAHIPWKRTVRPRYVWGAQCFQTELIPSHNMIEMQLQCVNREVSQRSPRIQDIAALYLFHTKILRCKILYVFSHSIIYHTVWYFSTYLLSYSNFNNEYAQSPITLHLWHRNYFNFRKTVLPLGRRGKASVQYMKSKCYMHDAIQIMNIRINNEMCQMTKIGYYWVVKFHTIRHRWLYNCREGYAASFLWYTTR